MKNTQPSARVSPEFETNLSENHSLDINTVLNVKMI